MMEFYHHRVEEKSQISGVPLSFANDQPGKYLNIKNSQWSASRQKGTFTK